MLRDTSIMYDLCTTLKENRYINHSTDEILTKSQERRIDEYIDDLSIDLFFRLAGLKKIIITPQYFGQRFTPHGVKKIDTDYELNFNSPYDRYTFLSVITHPNFLQNKFFRNSFASNLFCNMKRFGATGSSFILKMSSYNPYIDAFKHEYRILDMDFNRSAMLYCLRDFMRSFEKEVQYNISVSMNYATILSDYASIKDDEVFPGISLEYALSLYVILVEKSSIYEDGISPIISFGFEKDKFDITDPLQLFHNFELKLDKLFRRDEINYNDIFLRFVNPEKSNAFSIIVDHPFNNYVTIKLFNEQSINDVWLYNTTPLPYLYHNLYNKI